MWTLPQSSMLFSNALQQYSVYGSYTWRSLESFSECKMWLICLVMLIIGNVYHLLSRGCVGFLFVSTCYSRCSFWFLKPYMVWSLWAIVPVEISESTFTSSPWTLTSSPTVCTLLRLTSMGDVCMEQWGEKVPWISSSGDQIWSVLGGGPLALWFDHLAGPSFH